LEQARKFCSRTVGIWEIQISVGSINYSINVTGKAGYSNKIFKYQVFVVSSRDSRQIGKKDRTEEAVVTMSHSGFTWGSSDRSVAGKRKSLIAGDLSGPLLKMGRRPREIQEERGNERGLPI